VELLPEDDARPIVPPSDTELNAILDEARAPALLEVAPLLPEAIELAVETGLRKEELFRLTWRSVDTSLGPKREGAIRVEEQTRSRLVGGKKLWRRPDRDPLGGDLEIHLEDVTAAPGAAVKSPVGAVPRQRSGE
jgi:hypothetical protein